MNLDPKKLIVLALVGAGAYWYMNQRAAVQNTAKPGMVKKPYSAPYNPTAVSGDNQPRDPFYGLGSIIGGLLGTKKAAPTTPGYYDQVQQDPTNWGPTNQNYIVDPNSWGPVNQNYSVDPNSWGPTLPDDAIVANTPGLQDSYDFELRTYASII